MGKNGNLEQIVMMRRRPCQAVSEFKSPIEKGYILWKDCETY